MNKPLRKAVIRIIIYSLLGSAAVVAGRIWLIPYGRLLSVTSFRPTWGPPPDLEPVDLDNFDPTVVIPKRFEPITEFPVVDAKQANDWLHEDELVLGVTVAGQSRAYPINILTGPSREIINDQLGGRPIAATW